MGTGFRRPMYIAFVCPPVESAATVAVVLLGLFIVEEMRRGCFCQCKRLRCGGPKLESKPRCDGVFSGLGVAVLSQLQRWLR
ncbi:hypothetical protein BDA96_01G085600 [Sorghum bicolor]|uniref:Uncharacterized protein n=1 Tax=Sorghum bicolor TaxID=4558 RepID=A0A921RXT1_SORBI|nr:hypothetical protein BDA96_01G085600 [Sorghum bicolor]